MQGVVERRVAKRTPFEAEIVIRLEQDGQVLTKARATNISAGGIEFEIPSGGPGLSTGAMIDFFFDLPLLGATTLQGEIRHNRPGLDNSNTPVTVYGIKFLQLPLETWYYIVEYCQNHQTQFEPEMPVVDKTSLKKETVSHIVWTTSQLVSELQLRDGSAIASQIVSINFGGLTFLTREPLPDNTRITIRLAASDILVYLPGETVWCNPVDDAGFQIGVNFIQINEEQLEQLQQIINHFS